MFGAIIGAIGAGLAAIGTAISTVITTVGPVIATAAKALVAKLPAVLEAAKPILSTVSAVTSMVGTGLGIAPPDENAEELGAKLRQEGTRTKTEEESTQEYLDYLRNDVELDREKLEKMSEEDRMACEALGTTMVAKSIEEKVGVELTPDFLYAIGKAKLTYEQVDKFIKAFSENNMKSMDGVAKYISNDLSAEEAKKVGPVVKGALKELSPEMTDAEIQKQVAEMKKEYFSEVTKKE